MSLLMQWKEAAAARPMNPDGVKPEGDCQPPDGVLFLAGSGVTDATGQWSMVVRDALCPDVELGLVQDVSMVATTRFDPPLDMIPQATTISTGWTASGGHVTLHVHTWDCRCESRGNTPFSYHAAIPYVFVT